MLQAKSASHVCHFLTKLFICAYSQVWESFEARPARIKFKRGGAALVWREERRREEALNNRATAGLGGRSAALGLDNKETEEVGKE